MPRVAAVQLAPVVGRLADNQDAASTAIAASIRAGADIIVLPELATSGYVFESVEEARSVALRADSELFGDWAKLASERAGTVVVAGFAELGTDGVLYNSAAVVDASGLLGVYRKVHLWDQEKRFFQPGAAAPLVVDTVHGRVGVMICYDLEFPEWTRLAALSGVDILAVPTNWPLVDRPAGERVPEVQIGMAAARVNRMAVACADRSGTERGVEWSEATTIIGADGWIVDAVGAGLGTAWAEIDVAASRDKRLTDLSHVFDDRRPGLYAALGRDGTAA